MSVYNRPTRDNLSLKTMDIPGAMGKKVIPDRQLVYREKEMPREGQYGRAIPEYQSEHYQIDPYELQEEIRHSG